MGASPALCQGERAGRYKEASIAVDQRHAGGRGYLSRTAACATRASPYSPPPSIGVMAGASDASAALARWEDTLGCRRCRRDEVGGPASPALVDNAPGRRQHA